jgi:hypothetical protein
MPPSAQCSFNNASRMPALVAVNRIANQAPLAAKNAPM